MLGRAIVVVTIANEWLEYWVQLNLFSMYEPSYLVFNVYLWNSILDLLRYPR